MLKRLYNGDLFTGPISLSSDVGEEMMLVTELDPSVQLTGGGWWCRYSW